MPVTGTGNQHVYWKEESKMKICLEALEPATAARPGTPGGKRFLCPVLE